ncbi:acyl carrier protein [Lipingzhangella sp. LS1_29]|uniref:Acyl carrier protein n=1 Tax=Lipingzhangella rawalii TaxID=2055835 RepID=A0ABU2H6Y6_9ACTN|nr:acyl carrier protein [Lipingzhangella rawalii]MDS1271053.1 acyl carrier protein [Lipingzhangella rawalii]
MMATFTLNDLARILHACKVDIDIATVDTARPFTELDIDSLTLVELAERITNEYQVPVPPEIIDDFRTPQSTLDYVNRHLATQEEPS